MVEAVRFQKREALNLVDRKTVLALTPHIGPVIMALILVVSLILVVQRAGVLRSWAEDHAGETGFLVESCTEQVGFGADQWVCAGLLTGEGGSAVGSAELVTSYGAYASDRPYVGERIDAFHPTGDDSTVYPLRYKLNELARLYLSLIPRLLFLVGSALWLAGWFFTRNLDPDDFVARDAMRLPQRFGWRSKGISWILTGVLIVGINHLLTTRLLGSLDLI